MMENYLKSTCFACLGNLCSSWSSRGCPDANRVQTLRFPSNWDKVRTQFTSNEALRKLGWFFERNLTLYVNWSQGRTECILRFQAPLRAWTCRRHPARSSILWRLTCRRLSARSSVKNKGRAGGTLHVRRLKNTYIGFMLWDPPQIRAKLGPNLRKTSKWSFT